MMGQMIPSNKHIWHDQRYQLKNRLYSGPFEVINNNLIGYFDGHIDLFPYGEYVDSYDEKFF